MEKAILDILHRELRLVSAGNGELCVQCGETLDETWRVKSGCLEQCAKLIAQEYAPKDDEIAELRAMLERCYKFISPNHDPSGLNCTAMAADIRRLLHQKQ